MALYMMAVSETAIPETKAEAALSANRTMDLSVCAYELVFLYEQSIFYISD